jgi:hypothetical protein
MRANGLRMLLKFFCPVIFLTTDYFLIISSFFLNAYLIVVHLMKSEKKVCWMVFSTCHDVCCVLDHIHVL